MLEDVAALGDALWPTLGYACGALATHARVPAVVGLDGLAPSRAERKAVAKASEEARLQARAETAARVQANERKLWLEERAKAESARRRQRRAPRRRATARGRGGRGSRGRGGGGGDAERRRGAARGRCSGSDSAIIAMVTGAVVVEKCR